MLSGQSYFHTVHCWVLQRKTLWLAGCFRRMTVINVSYNNLSGLSFSLYNTGIKCIHCWAIVCMSAKEALVWEKGENPAMCSPSCTESWQVGVLDASSTLWYPEPITTHPTQLWLPILSQAVSFWCGGHCDIEGRMVQTFNLISQHCSAFTIGAFGLLFFLRNIAFGLKRSKSRWEQPQHSLRRELFLRAWVVCDCSQLYKASINKEIE